MCPTDLAAWRSRLFTFATVLRCMMVGDEGRGEATRRTEAQSQQQQRQRQTAAKQQRTLEEKGSCTKKRPCQRA
jgi:hypothetical protein